MLLKYKNETGTSVGANKKLNTENSVDQEIEEFELREILT